MEKPSRGTDLGCQWKQLLTVMHYDKNGEILLHIVPNLLRQVSETFVKLTTVLKFGWYKGVVIDSQIIKIFQKLNCKCT